MSLIYVDFSPCCFKIEQFARVLDVSRTPVNPTRTPTQIEQQFDENGTKQYFLQICTNLQNKQVVKQNQEKQTNQQNQKFIKNTEDKLQGFDEDSIISQSQSGIQLVYNKFNIVPKHYLLVQMKFIHQLEPIQCWQETVNFLQENNEFTGFYNCGRESGSSQVRQHVQLLELPEFTPLDEAVEESTLINQKYSIWQLKLFEGYKHGIIKFKSPYDDQQINNKLIFNIENVTKSYYNLLEYLGVQQLKVSEDTIQALKDHYPLISELQQIIDETNNNQPKNRVIMNKSYSLVITNEYLFICLRSKEGYFNSMSFSGYAFAKNKEIAEEIKNKGLFTMLKECMIKENDNQ